MKKSTNLFALLIITALLLSVTYACEQPEPEDVVFDAELIDRHLDAGITFTEKYRPQFHFTPRINWMNDPNGLVYFDGRFHLFYQYNPFGNRWGYMSWGHASSSDLVHWEHKPVAIPYGKEEEEGIFSGSAVVDHQNTSGFGENTPPIVAVYTSHYTREDGSTWQAQSLAYSTDGGDTFTKYEGNPVLEFDDPDFRDPNVSWNDEMEQWLMVVALPRQHKVQFYASDNLIDWEFLSDFGPAGAIGGIWECPDMFKLSVDGDPGNQKWVLHVDLNPGSVAGGSGSQYFIGEWDGTHFIQDKPATGEEPLWVDFGPDFYAAITWKNIPAEDGRRLWVGWSNNWSYANQIPTNPWRSMQSIARSLHLETIGGDIKLVQRPVEELKKLRQKHVQLQGLEVTYEEISLSEYGMEGNSYELILNIDPDVSGIFGIKLRAGDDEETVIRYHAGDELLSVNRTQSGETGFSEHFPGVYEASVPPEDGKIKLHFFVDWSSVELFVNDGKTVFTTRIFPDPESRDIVLFKDGGGAAMLDADFWQLQSIWH